MISNNFVSNRRPEGLKSRLKLFFTKSYWESRIVLGLLLSSILANVANWIAIPVFIRPTVPIIILHYNVYFGVDAMGNWINNFLALYFYDNKERITSYVLLATAMMVQLCLLIATFSVIIINY